MSVLIVGPKCTLAASHAAPLVSRGEYAGERDGQVPDHYITFFARRGQRKKRKICDISVVRRLRGSVH